MKKLIAVLSAALLMGATGPQHEKDSQSIVPAYAPTVAFPVGKAPNGNVSPILTDDAGAVVLSNPGGGGGGGTSANVQDAGVAFNRAGSSSLGVATNGVSFPILVDDAGATVISNPGSGGGGISQVYFDGGTVTATNTAFGVTGQGNTEVVTDGGEFLVSLPAITLSPSGTTTKTAVSTSTAASGAGYGVGTCIRLMCDVDVFYSIGLVDGGAATTSNVPLPQKTVEKWCFDGQKVNLAFITSSGTGSCYSTVVPKTP